jgi:hypothetical protein
MSGATVKIHDCGGPVVLSAAQPTPCLNYDVVCLDSGVLDTLSTIPPGAKLYIFGAPGARPVDLVCLNSVPDLGTLTIGDGIRSIHFTHAGGVNVRGDLRLPGMHLEVVRLRLCMVGGSVDTGGSAMWPNDIRMMGVTLAGVPGVACAGQVHGAVAGHGAAGKTWDQFVAEKPAKKVIARAAAAYADREQARKWVDDAVRHQTETAARLASLRAA